MYVAKLKFLHMPEDEKAKVAALTHELVPIVKKVQEILPLFLALSNDSASVQKILTMVRPFVFSSLFGPSSALFQALTDFFRL